MKMIMNLMLSVCKSNASFFFNTIKISLILDLTTSYGYYGSISFPIRPPSPFADGLIWSHMFNHDDLNGIYSSSIRQSSSQFNTNNNNNNNNLSSQSSSSWKQTIERILKRKKPKEILSQSMQRNIKHVHWIDDENYNNNILNICQEFVENLKIFVQNILNDKYDEIYFENCRLSLDKLQLLTNCEELKQAFEYTVILANKYDKNQLLQQQTFIADLISRTILSS